MCEWADKWKMSFNANKCKVMQVGRRNNGHEYSMRGTKLEAVKEEVLGVLIGDTLKPAMQCESAAKKGNAALGMIMRTFHYRTKATLLPLYKNFVRPKLEFAAMAWAPWMEKNHEALEKVQKRMVRMLSDVRGETTRKSLRAIEMTMLRDRRIRGDMIET